MKNNDAGCAAVLFVLVWLALVIAVVAVAIHFILKFW